MNSNKNMRVCERYGTREAQRDAINFYSPTVDECAKRRGNRHHIYYRAPGRYALHVSVKWNWQWPCLVFTQPYRVNITRRFEGKVTPWVRLINKKRFSVDIVIKLLKWIWLCKVYLEINMKFKNVSWYNYIAMSVICIKNMCR